MLHSFFHLLFISLVALFPVVNPLGSALIVNPYLSGLDKIQRKSAVRQIALYALGICVFFLFAGHFVLTMFGITIPVIQLAGGIMICKTGWDLLNNQSEDQPKSQSLEMEDENQQASRIFGKLFYPITFPMTTGAGTISVLFTLGAHSVDASISNYLVNNLAILTAIIIMCILIIIFYQNTKIMLSFLNSNSENIINKLMAFLNFCVGLQIATTGIKSIFLTGQ
ncbi:MAG: MarC family protein [Saprospiraceae bacterium]|jgi:multiple antibiotic resistance protein